MLEKRRKATRIEEAQLQAALEASAELEREEEERRLLKEKEAIEALEALRITGIVEFYESARNSLSRLHDLQLEKIVCRHKAAISKHQNTLKNITSRRDALTKDLPRFNSERVATMNETRLEHTRELSATLTRHLEDQDMLITKLRQHKQTTNESIQAWQVQALLNEQDRERQLRTEQQQHELKKLEAHFAFAELDARLHHEEILKLEQEEKEAKDQWGRLRKQILADWKWVVLARADRLKMLDEDEQILISSGAGAPTQVMSAKVRTKENEEEDLGRERYHE